MSIPQVGANGAGFIQGQFSSPLKKEFESDTDNRIEWIRSAKLSAEAELSLFFKEVRNPLPSWRIDNFASEWYGVNCNERGEVVSINTDEREYYGALNWRKLPRSVTTVYLHWGRSLEGEIDFSDLPPDLEKLVIYRNKFKGKLEMNKLPRKLKNLEIVGNEFSGDIDSTGWPEGLEVFSVSDNPDLKGTIMMSKLPKSLVGIPEIEGTKIEIID